MGAELLQKSKQFAIEIESKNAEYIQSLDVPSSMENELQTLLQNKENLEADFISSHQQQLMLKELALPPEQMLNETKMELMIAESEKSLSQSKVVYEENLSKLETTKRSVMEAQDCLDVFLRELSQKITKLENKLQSFMTITSQSDIIQDSQTNSSSNIFSPYESNLTPSINKRAKERILLLLENAKDERDLIEDRLSRLEPLHKLAESTANCVQSNGECQMELNKLQEKLMRLELLSGVKCVIIDDVTVRIQFTDSVTMRLPDEDKLIVTLKFTPDDHQCLELSAVNTNIKIPDVETAAERAPIDKDLPKLVRNLKSAWLAHVTLAAEISSLRDKHAIDWKPDSRVFHLMIAKYICRLSIPLSYPCDGGHIALEQIMGGQSNLTAVTKENPPSDVSLTGWVTHLQSILA